MKDILLYITFLDLNIIFVRGWALPSNNVKTLSVNPAVNGSSKWVPFSNQIGIRQRKERDGLCLSSAVPKIQWYSNPNCPYGY